MTTSAPDPVAAAVFLILGMSIAGAAHVCWLKLATADWLVLPLDGGRRFRGRRLLGANKMVRGLLIMPPAAAASFALLSTLWIESADASSSAVLWAMPGADYARLGFAAGLAFMLAELPNSFLKRQFDVEPGMLPTHGPGRWVCALADRLDSVLGVLVVVTLLVPVPAMTWLWTILIGPGAHGAFSLVLHHLGIKARAL